MPENFSMLILVEEYTSNRLFNLIFESDKLRKKGDGL